MKELNQQEIQSVSGAGDWRSVLVGSTFGAVAAGGIGLLTGGPILGVIGLFSGGVAGGFKGYYS